MTLLDLPADLPLSAEASARLSADITISPSLSSSLNTTALSTLPQNTAGWHVAVTRPGMFPMPEARCPCEKAPCGLVMPRLDIPCDVHHAHACLHQAHSAGDCRTASRGGRRAGRRVAPSNRAGLGGLLGGLLRR